MRVQGERETDDSWPISVQSVTPATMCFILDLSLQVAFISLVYLIAEIVWQK